MTVEVTRRGRTAALIAFLTMIALAGWCAHHVVQTLEAIHGRGTQFGLLFTAGFCWIVLQTILYYLERPVPAWSWHEEHVLDRLKVVVPVPVYNEDPEFLRRCLWSLLAQSRRPDLIYIVDDGSTQVDYREIHSEFARAAAAAGVAFRWTRTPNQGKRGAQSVAFARVTDADIFVTIDSDGLLDRHAIREILRPFRDPDVMSVAGIMLALNATRNLLTRFTDVWFTTTQLVTRSGQSAIGSVLVNSGPLAAYRAEVVQDNLDGYLNETFCGRPVKFADDSMLTLYAKMRGRTVQQPSSVVLVAMPENVGHHLRQYLRWMRGSFIRSCWRARYLPLNSAAFWLHAAGWLQIVITAVLAILLGVYAPLTGLAIGPDMLLITAAVAFGQSMRYMTYRRSDTSIWQQLLTLATVPVGAVWSFFVLRSLRWYGIATCRTTGWGTRQTVEVTAEPAAPPAAAA